MELRAKKWSIVIPINFLMINWLLSQGSEIGEFNSITNPYFVAVLKSLFEFSHQNQCR